MENLISEVIQWSLSKGRIVVTAVLRGFMTRYSAYRSIPQCYRNTHLAKYIKRNLAKKLFLHFHKFLQDFLLICKIFARFDFHFLETSKISHSAIKFCLFFLAAFATLTAFSRVSANLLQIINKFSLNSAFRMHYFAPKGKNHQKIAQIYAIQCF